MEYCAPGNLTELSIMGQMLTPSPQPKKDIILAAFGSRSTTCQYQGGGCV